MIIPSRRTINGWICVGLLGPSSGAQRASSQSSPWDSPITFAEEFDSLSVSRLGIGTRWSAHTPWNGDFGEAKFVDPQPGFPFTVKDGILGITAQKDSTSHWKAGLLSSTNPQGQGFSQQYGYFEMRAKVPAGEGVWPAFWLAGINQTGSRVEIDILEYYGHDPQRIHSSMHVWPHGKGDASSHETVRTLADQPLANDFHTFGANVTPVWTDIYFDRQRVQRFQTPPEHRVPLGILVDLALGSGWPIDKTPNPSVFLVDYVRAYAPQPNSSPA